MYASKYDQKSVFECFAGRVVHDEQGKITQKLEVWAVKNGQHEQHNFRYFYDAKGRLVTVYRNGMLMEGYVYNADGQRIRAEHLAVNYTYGKHGWLNKAGDLVMRYDASGQLATRENNARRRELERLWARNPRLVPAIHQWGRISFSYERQKLVQAVLPSMSRVRYEYEHNSVMPTHIYLDNKLAWQCQWCDAVRPLRLVDVMQGMSYEWIYNEPDDFLPIRIFVQGRALENLGVTSGVWGADSESFLVAYDQVGTLRALINSAGEIVKRIDYDSFGNVLHDTLPEFFIPQGFASGMTDPFTGLVKFGYRYYDPQVGRFITKDPAKDMRGDGDLYDYCVDDPIGRVDRDGRFFFPLLLGLTGALGLGLGGSYFAASSADSIQESRTGKKSNAAKNAVNKVVEPVAMTVATGGAVGGGLAAASGASLAGIAPTIPFATKGMEFMTQHADKFERASDVIRGAWEPGLPPASPGGVAGAIYGNRDLIEHKANTVKEWGKNFLNNPVNKNEINSDKPGIRVDSKSGVSREGGIGKLF